MTETQSTLSRRTFVKGSLAGLAATGAAGTALFGCAPQSGTGAGRSPWPPPERRLRPTRSTGVSATSTAAATASSSGTPRWQSALHGDR